jgi:D-alanine-D-alanine ligase
MTGKRRIRIGVLFGGRSGEHEISLRSALTVITALDRRRYDVVPIGIDRDGHWFLEADAISKLADATPSLKALNANGIPITLNHSPEAISAAKKTSRQHDFGQSHPGKLDVIFPVLHGTFGEDGTVQGLLELAGIPYVGAGVLGSAIGMDKDVQKRLLRESGVPVVRYAVVRDFDYRAAPARTRRLAADLGYPLYVKPNALGSSIGVRRVTGPKELMPAIREAFRYDRKVLLEAACEGRELECAVLGNDRPRASVVGEIIVRGEHRFYSYESKYVDSEGAHIAVPADLPASVSRRIREMAIAAFRALELRGMARVDFLARPDLGEIFVNEVNTIPGFTSISMYPKLWEASGVALPRLVDRLVKLALEDHAARRRLEFTYQPPRCPR